MTWATLIPVIVQYGLPVAMRIWELVDKKTPVTAEDWNELLKLADKPADAYLTEAIARLNARSALATRAA